MAKLKLAPSREFTKLEKIKIGAFVLLAYAAGVVTGILHTY